MLFPNLNESYLQNNQAPECYTLYNCLPYIISEKTLITIDVPERSFIKIVINDFSGNEVCIIAENTVNSGKFKFEWNALNINSGVYVCRFIAKNKEYFFVDEQKIYVVKD